MPIRLVPIPCPDCGEAQNKSTGQFDPFQEPFGPMECMVCNHAFTREEYFAGLRARIPDFDEQIKSDPRL
ncbi:MAG: hypothetical protein ACO3MW_08075 [Rhodospirillales bacterium]|jgi:hypothetical protein